MQGYRAAYGRIFDGDEQLDDGVLLMYRAPHSYTGEDTAEISCHGGIYVTRRVLSACVKAGAQPAAPGEFTKTRAVKRKALADPGGSRSGYHQRPGRPAP